MGISKHWFRNCPGLYPGSSRKASTKVGRFQSKSDAIKLIKIINNKTKDRDDRSLISSNWFKDMIYSDEDAINFA